MSLTSKSNEKTCVGCGLVFGWRNELDLARRDLGFCSSVCQRRAGFGVLAAGKRARPNCFPAESRSLDPHR
jgi:hypothetical protein